MDGRESGKRKGILIRGAYMNQKIHPSLRYSISESDFTSEFRHRRWFQNNKTTLGNFSWKGQCQKGYNWLEISTELSAVRKACFPGVNLRSEAQTFLKRKIKEPDVRRKVAKSTFLGVRHRKTSIWGVRKVTCLVTLCHLLSRDFCSSDSDNWLQPPFFFFFFPS